MNEEGIAAIMGLVLMTQPDHTVRIPFAVAEAGLPANSGVRIYQDDDTEELIVTISGREESGVDG